MIENKLPYAVASTMFPFSVVL